MFDLNRPRSSTAPYATATPIRCWSGWRWRRGATQNRDTARCELNESNEETSRKGRGWLAALVAFIVAGGLLVGARYFFEVMYIPQNGLYPNLPAESRVLVQRRAYATAQDIARGDYIVFTNDYEGRPFDFIWRVVGLPGEIVQVADGRVFVDEQPFERERLRQEGDCQLWRESFGDLSFDVAECPSDSLAPSAEVALGDDEVFVLGDNRNDAVDSRYLGPISFEQIRGKATPFLGGRQ
jgi:signal peptidase I